MEQLGGELAEIVDTPEQERALYRFEHDDGRVVESYDPLSICPYLAFLPDTARDIVLENARVKKPDEVQPEDRIQQEESKTNELRQEKTETKTADIVSDRRDAGHAIEPDPNQEQASKLPSEAPISPLKTLETILRAHELEHIEEEAHQEGTRHDAVLSQSNQVTHHGEREGPLLEHSAMDVSVLPTLAETATHATEVMSILPVVEQRDEQVIEAAGSDTWQVSEQENMEWFDELPAFSEAESGVVEEYFFAGVSDGDSFEEESGVPSLLKQAGFSEESILDEPGTSEWYEFDGAFESNEELPAPLNAVDFEEFIDSPEPEVLLVRQLAAQIEALADKEGKADAHEETKAILSLIMAELAQELDTPDEIRGEQAETDAQLLMYVRRMLVCLELPDNTESVQRILSLLRRDLLKERLGTHELKSFGENWVTNMLAKTAPVGHQLGRAVLHFSQPLRAAA